LEDEVNIWLLEEVITEVISCLEEGIEWLDTDINWLAEGIDWFDIETK